MQAVQRQVALQYTYQGDLVKTMGYIFHSCSLWETLPLNFIGIFVRHKICLRQQYFQCCNSLQRSITDQLKQQCLISKESTEIRSWPINANITFQRCLVAITNHYTIDHAEMTSTVNWHFTHSIRVFIWHWPFRTVCNRHQSSSRLRLERIRNRSIHIYFEIHIVHIQQTPP